MSHLDRLRLAAILGASCSCALLAESAESPSFSACARADLALMYKLADEHGTSAAPPSRLVQAAMKMVEARAACRRGDYAAGLAIYAQAETLVGAGSP